MLVEPLQEIGVQGPRRRQIAAERFLDDHAFPARTVPFGRHAGVGKAIGQGCEEFGIGCQVKEPVAGQLPLCLQILDPLSQTGHAFEVIEVGAVIEDIRQEPLHQVGLCGRVGPELRQGLPHVAAKCSSVFVRRPTPTIANSAGRKPLRHRPNSAGRSLRAVRSPVAPKITSTAGCTSGFWSDDVLAAGVTGRTSVWADV